jgi:two-component system cell cycle sensor histidine kinase/response regulator CckA
VQLPPLLQKVLSSSAGRAGLRVVVAASALLLLADLIDHGTETWNHVLESIDGPVFGALVVWGGFALWESREAERRARDEARDAENRRERLFRGAPVALFRASADGVILDANPALHELLQVPARESLIGSSTLDWYAHPEEREAIVRAILDGDRAQHYLELKRRDGQVIWVVCTCQMIKDPITHAIVFEGGFVDVTERRHAVDLIRATERRYRALTEKSSDGVTLFSRDLIVTYRSAGAMRLLGIPEESKPNGGSCFEKVHPDDRDAFFELVREVLDTPGASREGTIRLRRLDNTAFWAAVRITNLLDDPDVRSMVINFRDVSERVEGEGRLRASEERFREMADHIKESFFVAEPETGRVLYVSPTWSEIWGRPISDGLDPSIWLEAVHPDDRPAVIASQKVVAAGRADETTFRVRRPDGSERWVRGRAYPVRSADGVVTRVVGVSEDITELRGAEAQFTQAQKLEAVARLAGGIAHDFNNLLTVIIAESDFAMRHERVDAELREGLENIRGASDQAASLTRQLLLFSRRQVVEPTNFDLNDVVAETGKLLRRVIGEDVTLTIHTASQNTMVRADRGQMEQVLTNLAVNARDAMPGGGALSISTGVENVREEAGATAHGVRPGRYATVQVADTGCGMTAEVMQHAFEPFFTTKERGKGTGLGLASSYGIIKEAGGEVRVTSAVGEGTTFTIYLPLVESVAQPRVANRPTPVGTESILVVEDEDAVRRVAARILRSQGYSVIEARDAAEAIGILVSPASPVDLLLTDMVMPGMSGSELAAEALLIRPGLKILFVTGYTDDQLLQEKLLASDADLLRKPYSRAVLAQRVRDALDGNVPALATG